jgi:hypothetical protein
MALLMQGITGMLTNSIVAWDGVTLPSGADSDEVITMPLTFDSTLNDEFELAVNGPITIIMPSGITLEKLESSQGNIVDTMLDGRQHIVYTIPAGDVEDTITFQLHFSWLYFLVQFWKYPAIVLILLLLFIRRRRKTKKKKKARKAAAASQAKPMIGNAEFADLSGFHSSAFHGELDELNEYNNAAPPPVPPSMESINSQPFEFAEDPLADLGEERFD